MCERERKKEVKKGDVSRSRKKDREIEREVI